MTNPSGVKTRVKAVPTVSRTATARRNRGGRPTKDVRLVCSEKVTVYLTIDELGRLKASHQLVKGTNRLSLNEFVRQQLFAKRMTSRQAQTGLPGMELKKLNALVTELKRIGVNYNQSVKRLNQFHISVQLRDEFKKNAALAGEILSLIEQTKKLYGQLEQSATELTDPSV